MYGVVRLGAIECKEEQEMCEEFTVNKAPSILVFTEFQNDKGEIYKDKIELSAMQNFLSNKMQNFVNIVTHENFKEFLGREPSKKLVLLFTERKQTAPLIKALSKQYKSKIIFGEVRSSEQELISKYQITKFPSLITIPDSGQEMFFEVYQNEISYDALTKYLNI